MLVLFLMTVGYFNWKRTPVVQQRTFVGNRSGKTMPHIARPGIRLSGRCIHGQGGMQPPKSVDNIPR